MKYVIIKMKMLMQAFNSRVGSKTAAERSRHKKIKTEREVKTHEGQ